jgi:nucleoside-diphosphate-sugar epimerase
VPARHKFLVTGASGQVGFAVARALAREHDVTGLARLAKAGDRQRLESAGIRPLAVDLASGALDALPDDFDYVLHFAVVKGGANDFDRDLAANAEGSGRLIAHCRRARAFLHCSSAAVYQAPLERPARESDPLGDNHRSLLPTYSLCKIASEAVARFAAREFGVRTAIARLSVPYGSNGGWPWFHLALLRAGRPIAIHPRRPNLFNPIHEDDIVAQVPALLAAASVPAQIVNWGGSETVALETWCEFLGELTGKKPVFHETESAIASLPVDLERMHALLGRTRVDWRDGLRRMVEERAPELLQGPRAG